MDAPKSRAHICCAALGTRGDVQPIICLALHLQSYPDVRVSIVTHRAHANWMDSGIYSQLHSKSYVDSPPAFGSWAGLKDESPGPPKPARSITQPDDQVVAAIVHSLTATSWKAASADVASTAASNCGGRLSEIAAGGVPPPNAAADSNACDPRQSLPQTAVRLGLSVLGQQGGDQQQAEEQKQGEEQQPQIKFLVRRWRDDSVRHLILFNLFALEAYHAAEALGVRCAVAAPYMIPYRCPTAFTSMFQQNLPHLYDALTRALEEPAWDAPPRGHQTKAMCGGPASASTDATVSYAEVSHWMWPVFTERWGDWRSKVLGLPPLPFHYPDRSDEPLPLERLPPAPPFLYGFSELLVPRPIYWPRSVTVCGFWQPPHSWFRGHKLPAELEPLVSTGLRGSTVCCVDFGSSGRLGLIPDPSHTLGLLEEALRRLSLTAIVLTSGWQPLHEAAARLRQQRQQRQQKQRRPMEGLFPAGRVSELGYSLAYANTDCGGGWRPDKRCRWHEAASTASDAPYSSTLEPARGGEAGPLAASVSPALDGGSRHDPTDVSCVEQGQNLPTALDQIDCPAHSYVPMVAAATVTAASRKRVQLQPHGDSGGDQCAATSDSPPRLHLYGGDVPHQVLLPYCCLVLHHAGSGTTAAALQCGTPQVTCPLHFDQHFWAERLAHLDLSPPPLHREVLFGSGCLYGSVIAVPGGSCKQQQQHEEMVEEDKEDAEDPRVKVLVEALRDAISPTRSRVVQGMAQDLAQERGLEIAAEVLLQTLGT